MRRRDALAALGFAAYVLIVCTLTGLLGVFVHTEAGAIRQRDAEHVLTYFQQTMQLKLHNEASPVSRLSSALEVDPDDESWLPRVANDLLEREEIAYVAYVRDETMAYAYPEDAFGDSVGADLATFSYVYTLAKVTDGFVVEGPVELSNGASVFLFIEPVDVDGAYCGEMVVGMRASYVVEQLNLASLEEAGYRYELWAVSPQDGSKDVIAASEGGHDFSHAVKASFNMPTQWTLSIMPEQGWVPQGWLWFIAAGVIATQALAVGLGGTVVAARRSRRLHAEAVRSDDETGLLTYRAFIDVLDQAARCSDGCAPFTIVCLTVDGFEHTALSLGWDARRAYLGSVKGEIDAVVHGDYEAVRVSAGCFAIAIREYVDRRALGDLMRALELALLWKVRIDGKKAFCMARSAAVRFPEDGDDPAALVERTVSLLERDRPGR
ncbi:GGDEF domain-containing protein [Eggerthella timonensis]|uniref:GGDEF domain-containing protein n=1 Tax=Eggerthella timonensis TaxID=1871008 RepID=UPI000C76245C|nr:GGDEF domain-containing protein [Eggerthella timonensis]